MIVAFAGGIILGMFLTCLAIAEIAHEGGEALETLIREIRGER
jgi:hypothetical protein